MLTIDCLGHDTLFFLCDKECSLLQWSKFKDLYLSLHNVGEPEHGYKKNLLTKYNTLLLCGFHNEKGENHEVEVLVVCNLFRLI